MGIEEDDLHAYVDERLDAARRAEVDALLFLDPALRRQVDDWKLQRTLLRQAFAAAAKVPPALDVAQMVAHRAPPHARLRLAAGIVLGLAIGAGAGAGGGWYARGLQRPGGDRADRDRGDDGACRVRRRRDASGRDGRAEPGATGRVGLAPAGPADRHPRISARSATTSSAGASSRRGSARRRCSCMRTGRATGSAFFVLPMHGALTEPLQAIEGVARGQAAAGPGRLCLDQQPDRLQRGVAPRRAGHAGARRAGANPPCG